MKAFVITIPGLPLSEMSAQKCIQSAAGFGLEVKKFPAISRYEAIAEMLQLGLDINRRIYGEISDKPIGDRGEIPPGQWWLTTPELGCFISHFKLWEKCVEFKQPIMILEHDAVFIARPPELPPGALALNLNNQPYQTTVAYVLTPRAARRGVKNARKNGIQPSDEILWRSALPARKMAVCDPSVVRPEDGGISSIQFTRADDVHAATSSTNPWLEFSGSVSLRSEDS